MGVVPLVSGAAAAQYVLCARHVSTHLDQVAVSHLQPRHRPLRQQPVAELLKRDLHAAPAALTALSPLPAARQHRVDQVEGEKQAAQAGKGVEGGQLRVGLGVWWPWGKEAAGGGWLRVRGKERTEAADGNTVEMRMATKQVCACAS